MAKKKVLATIELKGLDITLTDVEIKNVGKGKGLNFIHLEERNKRWMLLHSDSELLRNFTDTMVVEFNRSNDMLVLEVSDGNQQLGFPVTKGTKINTTEFHNLFHIDELPDMTYRLTWNKNFFEESSSITSIVFKIQN